MSDVSHLRPQNLAYQADHKTKRSVLRRLGGELFRLLLDPSPAVQMKTLGLLRNLLALPHVDQFMDDTHGPRVMQVRGTWHVWAVAGEELGYLRCKSSKKYYVFLCQISFRNLQWSFECLLLMVILHRCALKFHRLLVPK